MKTEWRSIPIRKFRQAGRKRTYPRKRKYTEIQFSPDIFLVLQKNSIIYSHYSNEESVVIKNTNEEEIGRVGIDDSETKVQEIVKNNKDRFIKKKIYIKNENNNLVVERVEKC